MAPRPETTQAGAPASSSQSTNTALPGMKRGIAIGVAVSVATILIAFLAYCAVQRRKKAKSKAKTISAYSDSNVEAWPQDHKWPIEPPVVEADVATIHELDASPVPELGTTHPAQELEADKSPISELDSPRPASINESHTEKLLEWRSWNRALEGRAIDHASASDQQHPSHRDLPTLSISPPDNSESTLGLSPLGTSPMGVSPIAVSPLEDAYFPNRRFSVSNGIR